MSTLISIDTAMGVAIGIIKVLDDCLEFKDVKVADAIGRNFIVLYIWHDDEAKKTCYLVKDLLGRFDKIDVPLYSVDWTRCHSSPDGLSIYDIYRTSENP